MTDLSNNNGAGTPGLKETVVAKAPTKPRKSAAESARTFAKETGATITAEGAATEREYLNRLRDTVERVEAKAAELREWTGVRADQAREMIEEKPLTIVGAAFGVGLLLGLIASR